MNACKPSRVVTNERGSSSRPGTTKLTKLDRRAVEVGTEVMILISGTASITRSETRHTGDVEAQTGETLANIEALISEANLSSHGLPGFGAELHDLAVARVYIKRAVDHAVVRSVCESRLGPVPVTYTIADVCRPQLLVEIEGIAFSRWTCPR